MTIFEKMQPLLDQLARNVIGDNPTTDEAIEFANALVSRAAGTVFATVHPLADRHAAVSMWLKCWSEAAIERNPIIEAPSNARH